MNHKNMRGVNNDYHKLYSPYLHIKLLLSYRKVWKIKVKKGKNFVKIRWKYNEKSVRSRRRQFTTSYTAAPFYHWLLLKAGIPKTQRNNLAGKIFVQHFLNTTKIFRHGQVTKILKSQAGSTLSYILYKS